MANQISLPELQLKELLEAAFSDGWSAGCRNENSSLHDNVDFCEEQNTSVISLCVKAKTL